MRWIPEFLLYIQAIRHLEGPACHSHIIVTRRPFPGFAQ